MKKLIITLIIIVCSFSSKAQDVEISGDWLLAKVIHGNEPYEPLLIQSFKKNGKIEVMRTEVGTWKYNKKTQQITMVSPGYKDFDGEWKLDLLETEKLEISNNEVKLFYTKIDLENMEENNASLNFEGEWKLKNEANETQLLKIELPDVFKFTQITPGGGTSRSSGTWMYNPKEKSILFIGRTRVLDGKSKVKEISEKDFILERKGENIIGKKEISTPIERLSFEYEDFTEEQTENSPWQDFSALLNEFKNTKYLKFRQGELIPNTSSFSYKTLVSKVDVKFEERRISLANLSITKKDTMQYSESVKGNLINEYNNFFPQEELGTFRIVKTEKITVPAGEFNCKVIEGIDGDTKLKYWMIIDKPGVYAKIIREEIGVFDELEYSVIELEEIKK